MGYRATPALRKTPAARRVGRLADATLPRAPAARLVAVRLDAVLAPRGQRAVARIGDGARLRGAIDRFYSHCARACEGWKRRARMREKRTACTIEYPRQLPPSVRIGNQ